MSAGHNTVSRANVANAISMLQAAGHASHIPLFQGLRDGLIALVHVTDRTAPLSLKRIKRLPRPAVVLIGDDDYQSTGPVGWVCAAVAGRWAPSVIVHAAGGERQHYIAAVAGAVAHGGLLLVETSAPFANAWSEFGVGKPGFVIYPRNGVHPVMPTRKAMQ